MKRHLCFLFLVLFVCMYGTAAIAQFRVFVGDKPPEEGDQKPKQELLKQEPKMDTYDPSSEFPAVKKPLKPGETLSGSIAEHELAIDWDGWRNKFAKTVKDRMFSNVYEALSVRNGAITWYHCEVTRDKQLKNVRIIRSSGDFWYDNAVIKAINKVDGDPILEFPKGSIRTEVSTDIGIQFGRGQRGDLRFNDVEYRALTPEESAIKQKESEPATTESTSESFSKKKKRNRHSED